MPDPADTRIVVNSRILGDLAIQISEESESSKPNARTLLAVVRKRKHVICITDNIMKEYAKTENSGQYLDLRGLLTSTVLQLRDMGIAKRCRTGSIPDAPMLTGFGKQHVVFLQDAVRTNARYLLTVNHLWLEKATIGEVQIVSSARYVQLQES